MKLKEWIANKEHKDNIRHLSACNAQAEKSEVRHKFSGYNFAFIDEGSKREIRRKLLKAIAIPGYQVPFGSRELPIASGWGTGGLQITFSIIGTEDILKVIEEEGESIALVLLPGVQFYTGNFLDGTVLGKQGHVYRMGDGIALEPQKFPDAPNQAKFVSTRVDPGKPYRHAMIYRVSVAPKRR